MSIKTKKRYLILSLAVIAIAGMIIVVVANQRTSVVVQPEPTAGIKVGRTNKNDATFRQKNLSTSSYRNQGKATDIPVGDTLNSDSRVSSANGDLVLHQPIQNQIIQSGSIISGTSKESVVYFRLIDNKVGVIAQGPLDASKGIFGAKIQFQPSDASGRLDLYNVSSTGAEKNEIQIAVRFE